MPFTLSHAVLAPPLSKLSKGHFPVAALAIGCMTPDLHRLFTQVNHNLTHQWSGVLFPDLPIGIFFCLLWYLLYRPVIYRFLGIHHPLNVKSFDDVISLSLMSCIGIIIGTATHLIWDGFTHLDFRTFAFKDFLAQDIIFWGFDYPLHFILQIGSSIVTLPFLCWMCWSYCQQHRQNIIVSPKIKLFLLFSFMFSITGGLLSIWDYSRYITAELWYTERYFFIGKSLNEFTRTALSFFTFGCLLFLYLDRKGRLA